MGKALGMMACTTVVAVGLWITNGGDSPTSAAAGIPSSETSPSRDTNRTLATESHTAANDSTVRSGYRGVSAVRSQTPDEGEYQFDGSSSQKLPFDSPEKRQAVDLIKSARRDIQAGRYDVARKKALEAREIQARYALFEDNPQLVLSEIERRTGQVAYGPESSKSDLVTADGTNVSKDQAPVRQIGYSANPAGSPKDQALTLLKAARQEMQAGNLVVAREKALAAQKIKATYGLFEDNPELLLEDLNRLAAQQAGAAQPEASGSGKQLAQGLVKDARKALLAGQYEAAYEKATAAQQMNVAFDLLEDRPESVLQDLDRAMAGQTAKSAENVAAADFPPASAEDRTEIERARGLVREAREALAAGRVDEAWAKASAAEQMNVAFGVVEDRPELILTQIEQMQAGADPEIRQTASSASSDPFSVESSAARSNPTAQAKALVFQARSAMKQGQFEIAKELASQAYDLDAVYGPVDDRPELVLAELAQRQAPKSAATAPVPARREQSAIPNVQNVQPVYPAGMSADKLYEIGMSHLSGGNPTAAREAFLMAYKSGDQLSPRRRQQVQDFLRELTPESSGGIQLAASQGTAGNQLDLVDQQRALQYDRLRSEVMNAVFRAERLKEDDPDQALTVLDQALANIESSELGEEAAKNLINSIHRTQASVSAYKEQQAPLLEMKRSNEETLSAVEKTIARKIRVEQELAKLVDEYNKLMDERRYAEAEIIAKQAMELDPENPVSVIMEYKAMYSRRNAINQGIRREVDESNWRTFEDIERGLINPVVSDSIAYNHQRWEDIIKKRDFGLDNRERSPREKQIEESLSRPISLQFEGAPMTDVMRHIADMLGITIYVDIPALAEVGLESNTPISIDVDGIMLKSALNLILQPIELGYTIEDEVLKITNRQRQQGKQIQVVYPVADLVVPLSTMNPNPAGLPFSFGTGSNGAAGFPAGSGLNGLNTGLGGLGGLGGAQFQVDDQGAFSGGNPFAGSTASNHDRSTHANFVELSNLITKTVEPDSWQEFNGNGSLETSESTLSLVIRQTQEIHDRIADLLGQLRRLQDLQVTIEVRVITVSNSFFEQIGVDFDFNLQDTIPGEEANLPPFGTPGQGQQQQQNQGNQQNQASGTFDPLNPALTPQDVWGKPTIVGLSDQNGTFTNDLDVQFRQGSFEIGQPSFGGFDPAAGAQIGLAILSDIEAFFFIRAAQGDSRTNVLAAPKITLFNGQVGTVNDTVTRPFVAGFTPIVGVGAVGFQPIIVPLNDGVTLSVAAVISADRRYVRLSVFPNISTVLDIVEFSVPGGATSQFGVNNQGGGGGGGGNQQNQAGAAGSVTIQQPVVDVLNVQTTVSVPDGGTVLLGGVKRLSEGRSMAGVPILNKLPYISRLFKNSGVGRDTESIMLMVTPRIIIQEEEEALLGIPQ